MKVLRVSAMAAALVGALAMAPSASAYNMATAKSIEKQCKAMSSCNKGGANPEVPCDIINETCPPCVTFNNNGCFELVNGGCNFGENCAAAWSSDSTSGGSAASSASSAASKGGAGAAGSNGGSATTPSAGVASNSSSTNSTGSSAASDGSTSTSKAKDSGTDMTVVFGIVGAAIGVIAVAVIFLVLVRRSRAAAEDDDDMAATPPTKSAPGPSTTTNATSYAPYAQRAPANPTTPTNRVIKYYNDNAQPSPHGSRGGGGFGSQQAQQQPVVKTVRPAAAANAPTFFNKPNLPTAQMAPAPMYQEQTYHSVPSMPMQPQAPTYQEHNYHHAQMASAQPAVPQAEPLFTVHTGPDEPQVVRRVSSPRPRRESYEF